MAGEFKPILYLKKGCPFCFKLRLFLLEAGLLDGFVLREFAENSADEKVLHGELSRHFDKVSFPSAQVEPGRYMKDSDALITFFADKNGIDPRRLPTFQEYVSGPFRTIMSLFKENSALRKRAA
jgi:hypothetical protein